MQFLMSEVPLYCISSMHACTEVLALPLSIYSYQFGKTGLFSRSKVDGFVPQTTPDPTQGNCTIEFLDFQGELTPKVDSNYLRGSALEPFPFTLPSV